MIRIRSAVGRDAEMLPAIEQSAGEAFRAVEHLAWIADEDNLSVERYREIIAGGMTWVSVDEEDVPVGFLSAEVQGDALHIWELGVNLAVQRCGHGRALIDAAIAAARARNLSAITLTTFRDVAFNELFYRRLGFETLGAQAIGARLQAILDGDAERGLPAEQRCAMRLAL